MYPLHDFDYKHIIQSILQSNELSPEYQQYLKRTIDGKRDFKSKDVYFLIAVIQNNHELLEKFKELLINTIMENEGIL